MGLPAVHEARKRLQKAIVAAFAQRRQHTINGHMVGPGVYRVLPKRGAYGSVKFCGGKQEIARRHVNSVFRLDPVAFYNLNNERSQHSEN